MTTLKEQKEAFVTGFDGTSPFELILVCSSAPVCLWAYQHVGSVKYRFWTEVVFLLIPMIICQTQYLHTYGTTILAALLLFAFSRQRRVVPKRYPLYQKDTVTAYRGTVLYLTFIAILAVDFHVFPRKLVKTEVYGYSLMDIGAASFVIAAGFVSSRARGKATMQWTKWSIRMIPLVLIGVARLVSQKGLDYQEHVTEYGVHWNFFFTLACLAPISNVLPGPSWQLPLLISIAYQVALGFFGMQSFIESAPRTCGDDGGPLCDIFYANREGILSIAGFSSLYLLSEWIGRSLIWVETEKRIEWYRVMAVLLGIWGALTMFGVPCSRRSTNMVFLTWVLLLNLLIFRATQLVLATGTTVPLIMTATNRHGLASFLVANVLTGAVNLSINTLECSDMVAIVIIFIYMVIVAGLPVLLDDFFEKTKRVKKD